jgi:hypothetical protein
VRALLLLLALLGTGCSLGNERDSRQPVEEYFPSWIDENTSTGG